MQLSEECSYLLDFNGLLLFLQLSTAPALGTISKVQPYVNHFEKSLRPQ